MAPHTHAHSERYPVGGLVKCKRKINRGASEKIFAFFKKVVKENQFFLKYIVERAFSYGG